MYSTRPALGSCWSGKLCYLVCYLVRNNEMRSVGGVRLDQVSLASRLNREGRSRAVGEGPTFPHRGYCRAARQSSPSALTTPWRADSTDASGFAYRTHCLPCTDSGRLRLLGRLARCHVAAIWCWPTHMLLWPFPTSVVTLPYQSWTSQHAAAVSTWPGRCASDTVDPPKNGHGHGRCPRLLMFLFLAFLFCFFIQLGDESSACSSLECAFPLHGLRSTDSWST